MRRPRAASMMSARNQPFPIFELTLVVALALIAWAAYKLSELKPADSTPRTLRQLRGQYFLLSDTVETNVSQLDDLLKRAVERRDGTNVAQFQMQGKLLQEWIKEKQRLWVQGGNTEKIVVTNQASGIGTNQVAQSEDDLVDLLNRIDNTFTNYWRAALVVLANVGRPDELIKGKLAMRQQTAERTKQRLLYQGRQARIRGQAMDLALSRWESELGVFSGKVEKLRAGLLVALVALCFLSVFMLYKRKLALAQSSEIIHQHRLRQTEQQSTLDKLAHFGRLAQELAHEIKQPLTAIMARAYTLQRSLDIGSDAHKDAAVIRSEIKRLDAIVKDFLELARPTEPKLVSVTAEQALEQVRDLMAPQLAQEEIGFKFECEEGLEFMADLQQLKQVLINLVKNAAESLDGHGMVSLRARRDKIGSNGEGMEVALIEVQDTGPGIPLEIREKIFDPFFSTKGDGTGLGLAIAARIIDKHDGRLEFDTELGKGTTFRIILPTCHREQPA